MIEKLQMMTIMFLADLPERKKSERGATATEYGLLVGLIALAIIIGVTAFGGALNTFFQGLATKVGSWK